MNRQSNTVIQAAPVFQQVARRVVERRSQAHAELTAKCSVEQGEQGQFYLRAANLNSPQDVRTTLDWFRSRHAHPSRLQLRCRRASDGKFSVRAALLPVAAGVTLQ